MVTETARREIRAAILARNERNAANNARRVARLAREAEERAALVATTGESSTSGRGDVVMKDQSAAESSTSAVTNTASPQERATPVTPEPQDVGTTFIPGAIQALDVHGLCANEFLTAFLTPTACGCTAQFLDDRNPEKCRLRHDLSALTPSEVRIIKSRYDEDAIERAKRRQSQFRENAARMANERAFERAL
ncbi:hypothetical protein BU16DRAFT_528933 [Lophium mytilinum]|uniref:Uncharacterized protein n=1 Tax=Lophium mytilinum TaxID=390894 RepID=A0A6A6QKE3_9PEZI|nr:hypothetical protein BU16DRAFT_528933 [Lophium mytilinum]